ncbi:GIY-YIG nuclease family protein [Vibrio diabolicus]|uniref:GIY-YIG nuclease family protein n=1 Tax=Vibrio diabolicus TaxID=50719 RepID=UPI002ED95861
MRYNVQTKHRGWIYICVDPKDISICKIGMTKRELYARMTETTNPDYIVFAAYQVPEDEARAIEKYVHRDLSRFGIDRQSHRMTGRDSEWFAINAVEATKLLEWSLSHCLEDSSWCFEINRPLFNKNVRYIPKDLIPADFSVLRSLNDEYLNEIKRRDEIDVDRWLYGD